MVPCLCTPLVSFFLWKGCFLEEEFEKRKKMLRDKLFDLRLHLELNKRDEVIVRNTLSEIKRVKKDYIRTVIMIKNIDNDKEEGRKLK